MAAVPGRISMADIPSAIIPMMDDVWAFIHTRQLTGHGHNVWLYRPQGDGEVEVEIGVQLAAPFPGDAEIVCARTPAGKVAHVVHYGDYSALPQVFDAVLAWCADHGHAAAGVNWEIYGDWHEDAAQRRTDVYVLIAP